MTTALVTGASSGIGLEFARLLARKKYELALVARNVSQLESLATELRTISKTHVHIIAADLSDRSSPKRIYDELRRQGVTVSLLINNAGFGGYGSFIYLNLQPQLDMIQVNLTALTEVTGLFARDMVSQKYGKILNVASTAAFAPGPSMTVYYATKAYVLSFSRALAYELRGTGVTVTALCPGPTRTEFQQRAGMVEANLFKNSIVQSARDVAEAGYRGLLDGKPLVIPGLLNKILAHGNRFVPTALAMRIVDYFHRTP